MKKYESLAKDILSNVGGEENVIALSHCITRLRFKLKDESLANTEVLKNMNGVVTVVKSGGQYQVVIGNHVPDVYAMVLDVSNLSSEASGNSQVASGGSLFDKFVDIISGVFQPILSVLCAAGMIKGFNALFIVLGLYTDTSGAYLIFNTIGDALFTYLPVILGYTAAKKFGCKPFVGLLIGAALCYPAIQADAISAMGEPLYTLFAGSIFESFIYYDFFGIPFIAMNYTSTVIPVILIVFFASKVENVFSKIIPDVLKSFFVPFFTMLIALVLGFLVIGPLATFLSNIITEALFSVYNFSPILFGGILGFFWQILVVFGLHWGIITIYINNIATMGFDQFMMPFFACSFAQTAVVLAIYFKTKNKKRKALCMPAFISGIFGITEPAIYGITLPLKKPFIISCIASAIAGAFYGQFKLTEYIFGGTGIFEFPAMINPATGSMGDVYVGVIGVVVAMLISFVLVMVTYKEDDADTKLVIQSSDKKLVNQEVLSSPIKGEVLPLNEVEDAAFAQGALGKGIAIIPSEGKVYAPCNGVVSTLFPTMHAIGITSESGVEVLIHIGMNTVQLEGKGFEAKIKQGDNVTKGQLLMNFDIDFIKEKGFSVITPVVITNTDMYLDVVECDSKHTTLNDEVLTIVF